MFIRKRFMVLLFFIVKCIYIIVGVFWKIKFEIFYYEVLYVFIIFYVYYFCIGLIL